MSRALKLFKGPFGRIAVLDMDQPLVTHAHPHCHVLIKVDGPDSAFRVRDRDCPLTDASAVLVNAWEPHAYTPPNPMAPHTVILALYIEPVWLANIQRQLCVSSHPKFFLQPCVAVSDRIRQLADNTALEMLYNDDILVDRLETILFDLMIAIIEPYTQWRSIGTTGYWRQAGGPYSDIRIRKAMGYIKEHHDGALDFDAVAAKVKLSRAQFFALFRRATSLTPNLYANVLRVERAVERLAEPDTAVASVSEELGFSFPGHFTRFFRQHLGVAPSEYRRVVHVYGAEKDALSRSSVLAAAQHGNRQTVG